MSQELIVASLAYGIISILLVWFAIRAWRDVLMLVTAPARMGLGIMRVWAVARQAMREAWAARVWGVVLLWMIAAGVLLALARPYVEEERIPNYLFILLRSQEFLVLLFVAVLACLSLPRERERRTIITTGSKPLSRLELYLGKVVGFMGVGAAMLVVMALLSWGFLSAVNARIKATARQQLAISLKDYGKQLDVKEGEATAAESIESKRVLAEQGALFAYNYITANKSGMQVAGLLDMSTTPPRRAMRGGGQEKIIYHFPGREPGTGAYWLLPVAGSPSIIQFTYYVSSWGRALPPEIEIQATAVPLPSRLRQDEKTVRLRLMQAVPNRPEAVYAGVWVLDRPQDILGGVSVAGEARGNDIEVQVRCARPGVYLWVTDPTPANSGANVAIVVNTTTMAGAFCPESPRLIGFEKRDKQQFQGYDANEVAWVNGNLVPKIGVPPMDPETAAWRFEKVRRSQVPVHKDKNGDPAFTLSMELDVEKTANQGVPAFMDVLVKRQFAPQGDKGFSTRVSVVEKRVMQIDVPANLLTEEGEDLMVYLSARVPGHWIAGTDASVRVEQRPSLFIVNLLKSEAVIFVELTLLVLVAVTCSIRLGFPVALLTSSTVYILGWCMSFIHDLQAASGLGQLGFSPGQDAGWGYKTADFVLAVMFKLLFIVVNMLPNFSRYDPTAFILESRNIPWLLLASHGAWAALWVLPMVAVGYLMIRKQELA